MTENKALELMESLVIDTKCELAKTLDFKGTVIRALEDLQQYRAIGTVEDIEKGIKQSEEEFNMLMEYRNIGTIEEFKALKEKSVPKKPIQQETTEKTHYKCPCCNNIMQTIYKDGVAWGHIANYCERCGQKIDCKLPANQKRTKTQGILQF